MRAFLIAALSAAAAAAFVAGCTTTPTDEQKPAGVEEHKPGGPSIPPVDVRGNVSGNPFAVLKDPNNILSKRSIYYDFDKFDVKDEYRPMVEAHAKFLKEHPTAKMLIQGNTDERGSREYNVGLGQRRSDAVKKMLTLLGARENQIESVSLGEEKPSCTEHNESCWAKNRRDEMLYGGEY